jgi:protein-tyrosine phosphatase
MIQISPYPLWIGQGGEGHDFRRVLDLGIEAVIELAMEEPPLPHHRELVGCRFPLIDGTGNRPELLALAVRTVANLIASGTPTLVCCGGGMSRSPAVVATAMALVQREPAESCLKRIARHHPHDVSPGLWTDLVKLPARFFELAPFAARN